MKNVQLVFWLTIGVSSVILMLNLMVLSQQDITNRSSRHSWQIEFVPKANDNNVSLLDHLVDPRSDGSFSYHHHNNNNNNNNNTATTTQTTRTRTTTKARQDYRRSRTLVGILTADTNTDFAYRRRHRQLFQIWNDTRVCSLGELRRMPALQRKHCQLVYTFVLGAATDPDSPTLLVNASRRMFRKGPLPSKHADVNDDDVTLLNIKYVWNTTSIYTPLEALWTGMCFSLPNCSFLWPQRKYE